MKNDDNLLCAILRLILDDGDGSPSEVYVQKEFNCANIFLGFGKSQVRTNPLYLVDYAKMFRCYITPYIYENS